MLLNIKLYVIHTDLVFQMLHNLNFLQWLFFIKFILMTAYLYITWNHILCLTSHLACFLLHSPDSSSTPSISMYHVLPHPPILHLLALLRHFTSFPSPSLLCPHFSSYSWIKDREGTIGNGNIRSHNGFVRSVFNGGIKTKT